MDRKDIIRMAEECGISEFENNESQANNSLQFAFFPALPNPIEILRITKEGIWANPDIPVDEAAKKVLDAIDHNIKVLVQKAVEEEREKVVQWMMERGYATGHGDTIQELIKEVEWQVAELENEACAKVCDGLADIHAKMNQWDSHKTAETLAQAIRARGEK